MKRKPLVVETKKARYILNPGIHGLRTRFDVSSVDALVFEGIDTKIPDKFLEPLRKLQVHHESLREQNLALKNPRPVFNVDISAKNGLAFSAEFLVQAGLFYGSLLTFGSLPALAFMAPGIGALVKGFNEKYDKAANRAALLYMPLPIWGFRSAIAAYKLESFVADEVAKRIGGYPTIFVDYGGGHGDIEPYLRNPRLRDFAIGVGKMLSFATDKSSLTRVIEVIHNKTVERPVSIEKIHERRSAYPLKRTETITYNI